MKRQQQLGEKIGTFASITSLASISNTMSSSEPVMALQTGATYERSGVDSSFEGDIVTSQSLTAA
jgi:hypothetical protein